jgi:tripartite-type tricarboxylate transporter receptor subunit TctC
MLSRVLLIACSVIVTASVRADEFPTRTVTIISPYQAGGTSDIIARVLAQKLQERWGKPVIVENRAGANGSIGVFAVVHAAPDGHMLLAVASSALTINPIFYANLPYNVDRDLAPITRTGVVPNVLVVTPSLPAKSVSENCSSSGRRPIFCTFLTRAARPRCRICWLVMSR